MNRIDLIDIVKTAGINNTKLPEIIENAVTSRIGISCDKNAREAISKFVYKLKMKFKQHNRTWQRLIDKESSWLQGKLFDDQIVPQVSPNMGRPPVSWEESSDRSKRRMVNILKSNNNTIQLATAAVSRSKVSPANKTLGQVIKGSINDPEKARQRLSFENVPQMMDPEEALALKIQCGLSDVQYQQIRNACIKQNADILPPLPSIMTAKKSCYPENQEIKETSAKITLQSMLDHTVTRILETCLDKIGQLRDNSVGTLHIKAGMDGASSQSIYHQKFDETDLEDGQHNEESLFQTAVVPLKLLFDDSDFWTNKTPSSSHYYRSLHLQYKKRQKRF